MQRRFEVRKAEILAGCRLSPGELEGAGQRLHEFVAPFAGKLWRAEQKEHAREYVEGLVSDLETKNAESIAYLHGLDRKAIQHFVGESAWDPEPLLDELAREVGDEIGEPDGVIVFDPSAHPKSGDHSVGVKRQWCGRLGKRENCQVGIYMGYASRKEHAVVDERLYLPEEWARDRKRRKEAGVPKEVRFRTRHELALEMLKARRKALPHAWTAGDTEMGRSARFRGSLRRMREQYLLGAPSNTTIRDLEGEPPPYSGKGARPKRPFEQVREWVKARPEEAWTRIEVRPGEKGPIVVECLKRRVRARTEERRVGPEEILFVTRERAGEAVKHDYYLSNAPADTPLEELARVAKAEHRIEECLQRAKSEVGLSDYEVRTWAGWHHHHALVLMAVWFLVLEARRGKKGDGRDHRTADAGVDRVGAA
ncbi:MAG: IS701 family transposase [Planctomycetota bacterium]|jgi:SRSO17 transposase